MARSPMERRAHALVVGTRARVTLLAEVTGLLWALELVDSFLLGGFLDRFGVVPRTEWGLVGIFFAPFLHAGIGHLAANTGPFLILGFLVMARRRSDFWVVSAASALTAGLGSWLLGAPGTVHIGASGVIMGYLGFLMGRGIWEKNLGAMFLSLAVTVTFGGMLWGVLPMVNPGVSWQAHLFGFLGGLLVARSRRR